MKIRIKKTPYMRQIDRILEFLKNQDRPHNAVEITEALGIKHLKVSFKKLEDNGVIEWVSDGKVNLGFFNGKEVTSGGWILKNENSL